MQTAQRVGASNLNIVPKARIRPVGGSKSARFRAVRIIDMQELLSFNMHVSQAIAGLAGRSGFIDIAMRTASSYGIIVVFAVLISKWWLFGDRLRDRHALVACCVSSLLALGLCEAIHLIAASSFPSASVAIGFAIVGSVFAYGMKRRGAFCLAVALAIAFAEVFLGTSLVSGVAGGAVIGGVAAIAVDMNIEHLTPVSDFMHWRIARKNSARIAPKIDSAFWSVYLVSCLLGVSLSYVVSRKIVFPLPSLITLSFAAIVLLFMAEILNFVDTLICFWLAVVTLEVLFVNVGLLLAEARVGYEICLAMLTICLALSLTGSRAFWLVFGYRPAESGPLYWIGTLIVVCAATVLGESVGLGPGSRLFLVVALVLMVLASAFVGRRSDREGGVGPLSHWTIAALLQVGGVILGKSAVDVLGGAGASIVWGSIFAAALVIFYIAPQAGKRRSRISLQDRSPFR